MALVQCLKGDQKTFAAVAETVLRKVLNEGGTSDRIDVIFDDYREESAKNAEQENRGEGSTLTLTNSIKCIQWLFVIVLANASCFQHNAAVMFVQNLTLLLCLSVKMTLEQMQNG